MQALRRHGQGPLGAGAAEGTAVVACQMCADPGELQWWMPISPAERSRASAGQL